MDPAECSPAIKTAYSCYFEVQLEKADFGKSDSEHFKICNNHLLEQLKKFEAEGIQLYPTVSNTCLIDQINKKGAKPPGNGLFSWEHCPSSTAQGRLGVMRLVPREQHTPGSAYWRVLHPHYRSRGGYHEWAVPAGAPSRGFSGVFPDLDIEKLPASRLAINLKVAVTANRYEQFQKLLERIDVLERSGNLSLVQIQAIFNQGNTVGMHSSLLHLAARNGYLPMIRAILNRASFLVQVQNPCGNTPAHIAALHNRHKVLVHLRRAGVDLSVKNKKQETAYDIAAAKGCTKSLLFCAPGVHGSSALEEHEHHSSGSDAGGTATEQLGLGRAGRDSRLVYGGRVQSCLLSPKTHKPQYTFLDILKSKCHDKVAEHFIKKKAATAQQKVTINPPKLTPQYNFKDILKKQFGERVSEYFIKKTDALKKPPIPALNLKVNKVSGLSFWTKKSSQEKKQEQQVQKKN